ncbi:MAG TPA: N-acetylmuramoyl-L-alanine amidase, partial [Longimicrobiales bacterium]|nr:N-acetylmuramoyl-L-alanine amidase [Longimicrobiales bacterium]
MESGTSRGYEAVPAPSLRELGWEVEAGPEMWRLRHPSGARVELVPGDPYFRWGDTLLQLVDRPYLEDGTLWVPAQLLLDFFPFRLPEVYGYAVGSEGPELRLRPDEARSPGQGAGGAGRAERRPGESATGRGGDPGRKGGAGREGGAGGVRGPRVVVIDPGHGGRDLGALGPGGTREKDVALGVGLALARELERYPGLEVHLTRTTDVLVPLWRRGEWATEVKGERPGLFISIHANAMPTVSPTRGFETYFLSEARTEHERRVAAMENAPLELPEEGDGPADPGLSTILRELRNLDHQHWSALLAELVQGRLAPVHPGPDLGVKQAPFAVITNAVMPA